MTTWADLLARAQLKTSLKARLPLDIVLERELGVVWEDRGGRMMARCPFHPDDNPSFSVFGDGTIAGCWSCNWQGDVFDVLRQSRGITFNQAVEAAAALADELVGVPRSVAAAEPVPYESLLGKAREAWLRAADDHTCLRRFLVSKGLMVSVSELHQDWRVGATPAGHILIPHFDAAGRITGLKTRTAAMPTIALVGSQFPALYGSWRPRANRVVLTEGETDTWTATCLARQYDAVALGLPTGVMSGRTRDSVKESWLAPLAGLDVLIAFDGDEPGRDAARCWRTALQPVSERVGVVEFSDGLDISSHPGHLASALRDRWEGATA